MRIAIDIDSTLHHYWDQLSAIAHRRFGIKLPYDEQVDWKISRLKPEQLKLCVTETHCEQAISEAVPYEGAARVVRAWRDDGHFIHVTSHREPRAQEATARWLDAIGLPYDELYCSWDKISRCREIGIDLLIDDSPVNLVAAVDAGLHAATIAHPWNRDVCEDEDIIRAADWDELHRLLQPLLSRRTESV